jgi:predicted TIM-barrel fold metal-dependent hydrolase
MTDVIDATVTGATDGREARHIVISTDGHCGADLLDYKPYLEARYHDEFDDWARSFSDPWASFDTGQVDQRVGVVSYTSSYNWDSARRQAQIDSQGIAAEVLFPNTSPPFYPSASISAPAPRTAQEYELRSAGLRAHNRWLVDFCAELPGRRAGIAQIFLNDIDDTVREIRWAKEAGLAGVLLPGDHFLQLCNLYYPEYDAIWAVCEELEVPVHRHGIMPNDATPEAGESAATIGILEARFFATRPVTHMVMSGVFERFPQLKLVMTENTVAWIIPRREQLDRWAESASIPGSVGDIFGGDALAKLSRRPSDYIRSNVYCGSFLTPPDIECRHEVGVDRIMWGADFPHHESTSPFTTEALRSNFAGVPLSEVAAMLSGNAADVYGFDLSALREVADRIGPTIAEVDVPLSAAETPRYPDESLCFTFDPARPRRAGDD